MSYTSKHLLIVNDDAVATSFAEAREGKLGFVEAGAIVPALTNTKEAQFTVANQTSPVFGVDEIVESVKVAPADAVAGKATFNFANMDSDEPRYVKLINTTLGTMDVPMQTFEYETSEKIAAAINEIGQKASSPFYGFTATSTTNIVTVTAPVETTFRGAATLGAVVAYTVKPTLAVGTAEKLRQEEINSNTYRGAANKVGHPVVAPDTRVVPGATYVQYKYLVSHKVPNKAGTGTPGIEQYKITVAVKSDLATTIAALDGDSVDEETE